MLSKLKLGATLLCLAIGAALVLTMSACGSREVDIANGRALFQSGTGGRQSCAYCHSLRAAFAAGPFAPDLDRDMARRRTVLGLDEIELRKVVRDRIHNAACVDRSDPSRCMPRDLVTGGDAADVAAFVARCADNASSAGCLPPKPGDPVAAEGEVLFGSHLCQGCHSITGNVVQGPTMKGLAGSTVELTNGQTVPADDRYLTEAILHADAQIVKGYRAGYMTALVRPGSISEAQARALVAYIKTLK
jgi:mono/diheme cytochrome c family protein